jgi:hypothetical protein
VRGTPQTAGLFCATFSTNFYEKALLVKPTWRQLSVAEKPVGDEAAMNFEGLGGSFIRPVL